LIRNNTQTAVINMAIKRMLSYQATMAKEKEYLRH